MLLLSTQEKCMSQFVRRLSATALLVPALLFSEAHAEEKSECGPATYSFEHQRYTTMPCRALTPQATPGTPTCGPVAYSFADQNYSSVPCPHAAPTPDPTAPAVAAP